MSLPKKRRKFFCLNDFIKVEIEKGILNKSFNGQIIKTGALGFYIPKKIMKELKLDEVYSISIQKIKGIPFKVLKDGRFYLNHREGKKIKIEKHDITKVSFEIRDKLYKVLTKFNVRKRGKNKEFFAILPKEFYETKGLIKNIVKLKKNKLKSKKGLDFLRILQETHFTEIKNNKIVVYKGNRVPIIINSKINLGDISYYLGCYFADGTKKGNSWAICASTFEQANFYKYQHNNLLKNTNIKYNLSVTIHKDRKVEAEEILKPWKNKCNVKIRKIKYNYSDHKSSNNRNPNGTLILLENKELTKIYYIRLIKLLQSEIVKKQDKNNALLFIAGVLEGDGCLNARKRGHIQISSNDKEIVILETFLKVSNLNYKIHKEEKTGKVYANIGGLSIIENILFLKDKLFKYYPKRRKILIERLCYTPTALFLTREKERTSTWILKRFREKDILNKNNKLTIKGKKIKKAIIELQKELDK